MVAPSDKVFGLARMFELQGEGTRANLHVVRTMKEALAILGVQAPESAQSRPTKHRVPYRMSYRRALEADP